MIDKNLQQKSLQTARFQIIAPSTPSNSQHSSERTGVEEDVSSRLGQSSAQPDSSSDMKGADQTCRMDLSGAALVISSQLTAASQDISSFEDSRGSASRLFKDSLQPKSAAKGNYNRYYGYRLAKGELEDPRLKVCPLVLSIRFSQMYLSSCVCLPR